MALDYQYLKSLVLSAQQGDSNAFAELYAATYRKQYRFAYSYLKDEFLAQDALQETYILALKGIQNINDPQLFVAWLNQICFRVCFKIYQKQKKYHDEMNPIEADVIADNSSSGVSPESQVVKTDEGEYILNQIMKLPFSEAQAITLRFYHEMKIDEVADIMDVSKSTVKRYLRNGQEHLKDILKTTQPS
ncbi:MAG: RNA polymerase sigma factor [Firmicutes bacterium]|nr:RNA polymerase sigma factor [Bacillota bacterium]